MSEPGPVDEPGGLPQVVPAAAAPQTPRAPRAGYLDGEWHRLHPWTPLLRGGIFFIAIVGIVVANLRDRVIEFFIGFNYDEGDPVDIIAERGLAWIAILIAAGVLLVLLAIFYVSWRMHTFRITDEYVEVRSGVIMRTNRKGRLDRIQGVNMSRPLLARIVGVAKLEIDVAGQDGNIELSFLGSIAADGLRRDVLMLASGIRAAEAGEASVAADGSAPGAVAGQAGRIAGIVTQRAGEFLAPELDPNAAPPESIVRIPPGRLVASLLLSASTVVLVILVAVAATWIVNEREFLILFGIIPAAIGFGSYYVARVSRSLRFSIAGTPDGIRIGHGLVSTRNETLPPGRIHAMQLSQSIFWRPFGWWQIQITRAAHSSNRSSSTEARTTILPVGTMADVQRVIALVLDETPERAALLSVGATGTGPGNGYVSSPHRAAWFTWAAWKRNAIAVGATEVYLRRGFIWRQLAIVPLARVQSVELTQGPVARRLSLASIRAHTVSGVVNTRLTSIDAGDATRAFSDMSALTVSNAVRDTSHRWRQPGQQSAPPSGEQPEQEPGRELAAEPAAEPATDQESDEGLSR